MGSTLSTAVGTVWNWIVDGAVAIGRAIWHGIKYLFSAIWNAVDSCLSWLSGLFQRSPAAPVDPVPTGSASTPAGMTSATTQQKQQLVEHFGEGKILLGEVSDYFENMENIMKEDLATGNTRETERKLQEVKQKVETKDFVGRLNALRGAAPVLA